MRGLVLDAYLVGLRCALPTALRALPLPVVLRFLSPRSRMATTTRALRAVARSERVARRIRVADTCLYRSMVRFAALRSAGAPAEFVMGLRREAPETGHAWVELDGAPVGEPADERLVETFRFPVPRPRV